MVIARYLISAIGVNAGATGVNAGAIGVKRVVFGSILEQRMKVHKDGINASFASS